MSPRCVAKGAASPVIQIPAANSSYSFYSACTAYKKAGLKAVLNQISAPAQVKAGGNIGKVKTRLFTYQYNCDTNYGNCSDKEVFSLGSGVGLYDWKHYVNQNGQWVFAQESAIPEYISMMAATVAGIWAKRFMLDSIWKLPQIIPLQWARSSIGRATDS